MTATYNATYGSGFTPCLIFVYNGWYVIEGSVNVNYTREAFFDGIDVEEISDSDMFTAPEPITDLDELIKHVDEVENGSDDENEGDDELE